MKMLFSSMAEELDSELIRLDEGFSHFGGFSVQQVLRL